ncbi:MAG: hypothetical protein HY560_00400, partial [Gemmatimonadetes bacterium]|nr:hypothetical protein [Gemmatimonadota bacterium]
MRKLLLLIVAGTLVACAPSRTPTSGEPGTPLPGLPDSLRARFLAGKALFDKVY